MPSEMRKEIGLIEATLYGVGIILGAGVYALIGKATSLAGNAVWMAFLISAVVGAFTGLSYAELSSMIPKAGAEYFYLKRATGSTLVGFLVGWVEIVADIVGAATVALGFAGYLNNLLGLPIVPSALGLIAALSLINFWGLRQSSRMNAVFTLVEVFGLLLIIFVGARFIGRVNYLEFTNLGIRGVFGGAALIFFAYLGFEDLANIAEETRDAERNTPRALVLSIIITTIFYILVAISLVSLADWRIIAASDAPLALAASQALGQNGFTIMSFIALFATANTVLVLLIVGSREIYGISRDGSLPRPLSRLHSKTGTPWVAIASTGILSMLFVLIGELELVAGITDFTALFAFSLVNLSLILLRYRHPHDDRPFKAPLNIGRFPLIGLLGLISCIVLITNLEPDAILLGAILTIIGAIPYWLQRRVRRDTEEQD
jgi:APA family basic amino acid/polyamine antiporter